MNDLLQKALSFPQKPGCYLMKNQQGEVIYVGKAKKLKNRVSTYFRSGEQSAKTQVLVQQICDVEFILTNNEVESLVLENNLIKKYRPKYNIRLRDDKTYPYVEISVQHDFPDIRITRRPGKTSQVFGPYPEGLELRSTVEVIKKVFLLRDCTDFDFKTRKRPCILYEMFQCSAPCVGHISHQDYSKDLAWAIKLFSNPLDANEVIKYIENMMFQASTDERFERAIILRDAIEQLQRYIDKSQEQAVELLDSHARDVDIIGCCLGEDGEIEVALYEVRNSLLLGAKNFSILTLQPSQDKHEWYSEVSSLLYSYYIKSKVLPQEIIWAGDHGQRKQLETLLNDYFKKQDQKVRIKKRSKDLHGLMKMAGDAAVENLKINHEKRKLFSTGLNDLGKILSLNHCPRLLECFDVAVWQGHSPTASKVVFRDGLPAKDYYRYFHLQKRIEGNNDFAMLEEALSRRIQAGDLPDVFIVDGGRLQVKIFEQVLQKNKINVPVVGIAKSRTKGQRFQKKKKASSSASEAYRSVNDKSEERLILTQLSESLSLVKYPHLYRILVHMRDEAHRFSRKLHHKQEAKNFIPS